MVKKLHVVTTEQVPGYKTVEAIGLVWASSRFVKTITGAKAKAVRRLADNARAIGADAVVAVRVATPQGVLGFSEMTVYGTAVKLRKSRK